MKTYFITGATGAIGACLVPLLLGNEDTQARLLIRAKSRQDLAARMEKLFAFWKYPPASDRRQRIKAYAGDVCQPFLGMNPAEYRELAGECSHIIHSAGNVRMNLSLEEARRFSVGSARNIVAFGQACQSDGELQKLEFISTVGVAGRMKGLVPESWITESRSFHNSYEEAKAEAEDYIRNQVEKGLPATVHRPSMVVGDSRTGEIIHFQVFYHLCRFLSGRRTFGILPEVGDACLDIVPVDYVARAIIWSSNEQSVIGKIFHLCSGPDHSIPVKELGKQVRSVFKAYGYSLPISKTIPLWIFDTCLPLIGLVVSKEVKHAIKALPYFLEYLAEAQSFANRNTSEILELAGIRIPVIEEYLTRNFQYLFAQGYE
jgi:thioester reductase-like protein